MATEAPMAAMEAALIHGRFGSIMPDAASDPVPLTVLSRHIMRYHLYRLRGWQQARSRKGRCPHCSFLVPGSGEQSERLRDLQERVPLLVEQ